MGEVHEVPPQVHKVRVKVPQTLHFFCISHRLRRATTDRHESSQEELKADDQWRKELKKVIDDKGLHPSMVFGVDETPLQYCPRVKGTYTTAGQAKQLVILGSREKRCVTATPICSMDGRVPLLQIIWKGLSDQCHPRLSGATLHFLHFSFFLHRIHKCRHLHGPCCEEEPDVWYICPAAAEGAQHPATDS